MRQGAAGQGRMEHEAAERGLAGATAVILAGGLGTRLRSVVADRPKALAQVQGRPFLSFLLDQLVESGIRDAVLCTGYLGEQVPIVFGKNYRGLRLAYSRESSPLGTGGALRNAAPVLESATLLVMNGDSYCDVDMGAFWSWHVAQRSDATILLRRTQDTRRFGRVRVDTRGRVKGFDEKNAAIGPGWVNGGIYLLSRRRIRGIPSDRAVSLEREVFPAWVREGLCGYRSRGDVLDIGTPESYAASQTELKPLDYRVAGFRRKELA
jgi:D-glycero-alpha-D-manno-heptose 1-phosphate guanylyltransferase